MVLSVHLERSYDQKLKAVADDKDIKSANFFKNNFIKNIYIIKYNTKKVIYKIR